ncbi:hypothetical protein [Actinocrinis sp.]|uniref:hypothetical protein n=1 Tax=Actinocrinis sp. TaxID=1920516 RepID=UPI002D5303E8|nr:hypothetical protein [Actinocrinis sp.]HZP49648.1 hypothetical protein [Actinocrinis sp.]
MTDAIALRIARNNIDHGREQLAAEAQHLADAATRFAASIIKGGPYTGDASRLAQEATQAAATAARLDALIETIAYLNA